MRCIFVLDIFNGAVVHAVRGERSRYEPIERYSQIVSTSAPLGVLGEVRPKEVYVADLNLLTGSGENLGIIRSISHKVKTMADIGVSNLSDLDSLPNVVTPILGTETASLEMMEEAALHRKVVASLDMKNRKVLTRDPIARKARSFAGPATAERSSVGGGHPPGAGPGGHIIGPGRRVPKEGRSYQRTSVDPGRRCREHGRSDDVGGAWLFGRTSGNSGAQRKDTSRTGALNFRESSIFA